MAFESADHPGGGHRNVKYLGSAHADVDPGGEDPAPGKGFPDATLDRELSSRPGSPLEDGDDKFALRPEQF